MTLIIDIKVVPQSGKSGFVLDKTGRLKAWVKSPAERGLANQELIKTIAKMLSIAQDQVELVTGHASRNKRIKIHRDISWHECIALLGIEQQQPLF